MNRLCATSREWRFYLCKIAVERLHEANSRDARCVRKNGFILSNETIQRSPLGAVSQDVTIFKDFNRSVLSRLVPGSPSI